MRHFKLLAENQTNSENHTLLAKHKHVRLKNRYNVESYTTYTLAKHKHVRLKNRYNVESYTTYTLAKHKHVRLKTDTTSNHTQHIRTALALVLTTQIIKMHAPSGRAR
jgi:short subunit dehydrogenase-like uncharacterized protein